MSNTVLALYTGGRKDGSVSRMLAEEVLAALKPARTIVRDLADTPPGFVDQDWIGANFTPADKRTDAQMARLSASDALVAELESVDTLVIAAPIYNFGPSAAFKAWFDLVARVGRTFRYTATGPEGLLKGKRAIIAVASGGTEVGSVIDFQTGWVRHVLGFVGITDVTFVAADRLSVDAAGSLAKARAQIAALTVSEPA